MRANYNLHNFLFMLFWAVSSLCTAQDLIAMKNGQKLKVDIVSIGDKEVEFQPMGSDTNNTYIISKADIYMIEFRDGVRDTLSSSRPVKDAEIDTSHNWYFRGIEDADAYYRGKKSGRGAIFASALIATPVLGICPAMACSTSPPLDANLDIRDNRLRTNRYYMEGYRDEAFDIKRRKIWRSYVVASVLWVAVVGFMVY